MYVVHRHIHVAPHHAGPHRPCHMQLIDIFIERRRVHCTTTSLLWLLWFRFIMFCTDVYEFMSNLAHIHTWKKKNFRCIRCYFLLLNIMLTTFNALPGAMFILFHLFWCCVTNFTHFPFAIAVLFELLLCWGWRWWHSRACVCVFWNWMKCGKKRICQI